MGSGSILLQREQRRISQSLRGANVEIHGPSVRNRYSSAVAGEVRTTSRRCQSRDISLCHLRDTRVCGDHGRHICGASPHRRTKHPVLHKRGSQSEEFRPIASAEKTRQGVAPQGHHATKSPNATAAGAFNWTYGVSQCGTGHYTLPVQRVSCVSEVAQRRTLSN